MTFPDSPPPAYASLEGAKPPTYTLGDGLTDYAFYAFVLGRNPSKSQAQIDGNDDDEEKPTGIEAMPTEILHSIICLACSLSGDDPDLLELRVSQATIFSCAAVSRKWMAVTGSHKELWSRVLDFTLYPVPVLWRLLRISHPCLFNVGHRSAPVALSWTDQGHRNVYGIIRLIYLFRRRIRELHVEWGFGGSGILVHDLCKTEVPHLEVITWHASEPHDIEADARIQCLPLPQLPFKRLNLRRLPILLQPTTSLRLLTALSTYRCPSTTLIGWVDVLRSAPNLRFLSIHSSIRFDGHIPAIPYDSVRLTNLALLTIGSLTPAEAELHLPLLAAIDIPPTCGLHIASLPYVRSAQCRVMLSSKIFKMMVRCVQPVLGLELSVDQKSQFTMGNVRDPHHTLDWVRLGEQRVLSHLQSLPVPHLTITTHSSSIAKACKIFPQVISYFGQVTYDKVASFRLSLSPFEGCQVDDWLDHPCFQAVSSNLCDLFNRLHQVTSLSVNDEGALIVLACHAAGEDAVELARKATRRPRAGQAGPTFTPDFPLLRDLTLHASEWHVGAVFAREFISARLHSGYPLCTATLPPLPTATDACDIEAILSYERKPVGCCRIITTPGSPLAASSYFEQFCERT